MNQVTIVTLSGFPDIFVQFRASCNLFAPSVWKIVVTSGLLSGDDLPCMPTWRVSAGPEPFIFSRNANLGIRAAGSDDVLLMNDDVQFMAADQVSLLQKIAYSDPTIGILSPQFQGEYFNAPQTGNRLQNRSQSLLPPGVRTAYSDERLCFTAVFLKRSTIDRVGLLDERFDGYGREDDDYCKRVRDAGLKLAVTPQVVMRHGVQGMTHSASYRRVLGKDFAGYDPKMTAKWKEKWGDKA